MDEQSKNRTITLLWCGENVKIKDARKMKWEVSPKNFCRKSTHLISSVLIHTCTRSAHLAIAGRPRIRFWPNGTLFAAEGTLTFF